MIPGKQYKPEDIVEAAWRRRWFIVVPFVLLLTGTVIVAAVLPDRYRSEALLQVVPQQVPENYVRPTVTTRLDERLQAMSQQILSRTQLERIIQEFGLYSGERRRMIMEDVVETMRTKHVLIGGRPGGAVNSTTFSVGFEASDPKTAMLVAERLAGLFIRENLEDRSVLADQTDQFLESQLQETRRQLKDYETKLEEFRRANPGRMPGELQANQQALGTAQAQLQALQDSINRDRDRQLMLQRMMSEAASLGTSGTQDAAAASASPTARQLEQERSKLRDMQTRLKPTHPDIGMQQRLIRDLEQKAAAEALQQPVSPAAPASPSDGARTARLADLRAESDLIDHRLVTKQEDEKRLLAAMTTYRQRVDAAPAMESRLTELMRDYTTLQNTYQNLLMKSQEAKVAANLERRQIGEQFKIIDPARMPQRPTTPNRPRIIVMGALLALACGLGLAGVLEYRDQSLRTEEDVLVALALPVLALVPTMTTAVERRKERRLKLVVASSGALGLGLCAVVLVWKFRAITNWVR